MPPFIYELTLEIVLGDFIPYIPKIYSPLKIADAGMNYPIAQIKDVMMDGTFKIKISKPLAFPDTLIKDHAKLLYGEIPYFERLGLSEESLYIQNIFQIKIVPGGESDAALLGFNYEIREMTGTEILFKLYFKHPIEVSQSAAEPEKI
jgi:hypothetical protein